MDIIIIAIAVWMLVLSACSLMIDTERRKGTTKYRKGCSCKEMRLK